MGNNRHIQKFITDCSIIVTLSKLKRKYSKKLIAVLFAVLMIFSVVIAINSSTTDRQGKSTSDAMDYQGIYVPSQGEKVGNPGLIKPLNEIGAYGLSMHMAKLSKIISNSYQAISDNSSVYGIVNNTLYVNKTVTISNMSIGYGINITNNSAILTLNNVYLNEQNNPKRNSEINKYKQGQLIITDSKISGNNEGNPAYMSGQPINLSSSSYCNIYCGDVWLSGHINKSILSGNYSIASGSNISNSVVYGNEEYQSIVNSIIYHSYIRYSLNFTTSRNLYNYDNITISRSYHDYYFYGNSDHGYNGNNSIKNSIFNTSSKINIGYLSPIGNYFYDDYSNYSLPSKYWDDRSDINKLMKAETDPEHYRGSEAINDTEYPVIFNHVLFSGMSGFEIYGSGKAKIINSIITEQFFWTAFLTFFNYNHYKNVNINITNDDFYFYANSSLENNIDSSINEGGGNTYITTGEAYGLKNISIEYNNFTGILFTVDENSNQHGSYILGSYKDIKYNNFDATGNFNSGNTGGSVCPLSSDIELYQKAGNTNISHNSFTGLSKSVNALTILGTGNTLNIGENRYEDSHKLKYQVLINKNNNVHLYNIKSYPVLVFDGNYSYRHSSGTSQMIGYINESLVSKILNQIIFTESGLPSVLKWSVTFDGTPESSTSSSITFSLPNGSYSFNVGSVPGYTSSPSSGSITVSGTNTSRTITFTQVHVKVSKYTVTFTESGIPSGLRWYVTLNGKTECASDSVITFNEQNGTYSYKIIDIGGYSPSHSSGNITVSGTNISKTITFSPATSTKSLSGIQPIELYIILSILAVIAIIAVIFVVHMKRK